MDIAQWASETMKTADELQKMIDIVNEMTAIVKGAKPMNINEMTEREKSAVLLKLIGAWVKCTNKQNSIWSIMLGEKAIVSDVCPMGLRSEFAHAHHVMATIAPDLYDEKHMALAWRVLNWAYFNPGEKREFHDKFMRWWDYGLGRTLVSLSPEEAVIEWLDRILSLAIEAGMIE